MVCTKTYKTRADGTCHAASEFETIRKYEGQHTKLLTSALLIIRKDETGTMCNDSIIIQHPTYDDFGRMTYDDRSGTAADMQYSYDNMHGWLTQVRSVGGFEQNIYRETGSSQHYYNGSIAAMSWKMAGSNSVNHYSYTYDEMNRLTQAQYSLTVGGAIVHPLLQNLIPQNSGFSMENYGEQVTYDKNSNITSLKRYGMLNSRSYGLIDNLYIDHTGNQLKKVDDLILSRLTYSGASDFVDGSNTDVEYTYDANGSLTKDGNRGISSIEYDLLGNIQKINFSTGNTTQYIYSADGRRLRTIHYSLTSDRPILHSIGTPGIAPFGRRDSIENIGNLILKNGHPSQYLFDGGYASFNADTFDDWHYYIQDYMGNVRMVVNSDGTVEQQNHYYPYGGIIGNLSTNQDLQAFKFEGKELDRKFGLDWYDIHARQYDAIGVPSWNKVDALAEKNPHLSPYVFAGGNPVNFGDYDGMELQFLGDSTSVFAALSELQAIVGEHYRVDISNDGIITIPEIENNKTIAGQRLALILADSKRTTVNITQNSPTIFIGQAISATIDMTDIIALGEGGSINSNSAFMHEINEQYQIQSVGKSVNKAHNDSRQLEINMNGLLGAKFIESDLTPNGYYTIILQSEGKKLQTKILHMNGTIFHIKKSIIQ